MATSRTGTALYLQWRKRVLTRDREAGITNCPDCGCVMDYDITRQPNSAEPDHILADAYGGLLTLENGRALCRQCNQSRGKGDRAPRPNIKVTSSPIW